MANSDSDQEVPSDYEEDFDDRSIKDPPPEKPSVLDIFPISDFFTNDSPPVPPAQPRQKNSVFNGESIDVLQELPWEPIVSVEDPEPRRSSRIESNEEIRHSPERGRTPPRSASEMENHQDEITVLKSLPGSPQISNRSRPPSSIESLQLQRKESLVPVPRPRLLSATLGTLAANSPDLLSKRQIPAFGAAQTNPVKTDIADRKKTSKEPAKVPRPQQSTAMISSKHTKAKVSERTPSAAVISRSRQGAASTATKTAPRPPLKARQKQEDDDFPTEIPESQQERARNQSTKLRAVTTGNNESTLPRAKSASPMPRSRRPNVPTTAPAKPTVIRLPASLEEKAEQEKRYQLLKLKTQARLRSWNLKKLESDKLNPDLNSTYTVELKKELNPVRGKVLRDRQQSVRIPKFPAKTVKKHSLLRPATSVAPRRDSFSRKMSEVHLRSKSALLRPVVLASPKIDPGLINFTVYDTKHSPQTSYWLYMRQHPELQLTDSQSSHGSSNGELHGGVAPPGGLGKVNLKDKLLSRKEMNEQLKFFDDILLHTSIRGESQYAVRRKYGESIRKGLRLQNARSPSFVGRSRNSLTLSETGYEEGKYAAPIRGTETVGSRYNGYTGGQKPDGMQPILTSDAVQTDHLELQSRLKSQTMLKISAINDFTPENLKLAILDFYDYFRESPTFEPLSATEITNTLTTVFEELIFV